MQVCGIFFSVNTCVFLPFAVFSQGLKKSSLELYGLICYGELRKKIGGCEYTVFQCHEIRKYGACLLAAMENRFPTISPDVSNFSLYSILHIALQCAFLWLCVGEISKHNLQFALSCRVERSRKHARKHLLFVGVISQTMRNLLVLA